MKFIAYFENAGTPATGLSPTCSIWSVSGGAEVSDAAMTEIGGGSYYYTFAEYDASKDYFFRADGTATLDPQDRYVTATNENGGIEEDISDISSSVAVLEEDIDGIQAVIGSGETSWEYRLNNSVTGEPIAGAAVWVTSDRAGANIIGQGITDTSGKVRFLLSSGNTVYVWSQKSGYTFPNPDTEVIS